MTIPKYIPGYVPEIPTEDFYPVGAKRVEWFGGGDGPPPYKAEVAYAGLITVTQMSDGRCVAVWPWGRELKLTVFNSPLELLQDDAQSPFEGTVLLTIPSRPLFALFDNFISAVSCFAIDERVFINVVTAIQGGVDGWELDNYVISATETEVTNPNNWVRWGDLDKVNFTAPWGYHGPASGAVGVNGYRGYTGVPMVIGSRWILPSLALSEYVYSPSYVWGYQRFGVFVSDDHGVSWTKVIDEDWGYEGADAGYMKGLTLSVCTLPNGDLLAGGWGNFSSNSSDEDLDYFSWTTYARSTDDGANWEISEQHGELDPNAFQPILNNVEDCYVMRSYSSLGSTQPIYTEIISIDSDANQIGPPLGTLPGAHRDGHFYSVYVTYSEPGSSVVQPLVLLVWQGRVAALSAITRPAGGWKVGMVGIG